MTQQTQNVSDYFKDVDPNILVAEMTALYGNIFEGMSKKQIDRLQRIFPKGKPRYVRCYDNGGETADRYTVVFTGNYTIKTQGQHWYVGMSGSPFHPQGIGQHGENSTQIDYPTYSHLGKKVKFEDLPEDCQKCVNQTYLYLWDFTDEDGKWLNRLPYRSEPKPRR